jgi:hypothetical protein
MITYTLFDSENRDTTHYSRAEVAAEIVERLGADLPASLPGSEIVDILGRHSSFWVFLPDGRELSVEAS